MYLDILKIHCSLHVVLSSQPSQMNFILNKEKITRLCVLVFESAFPRHQTQLSRAFLLGVLRTIYIVQLMLTPTPPFISHAVRSSKILGRQFRMLCNIYAIHFAAFELLFVISNNYHSFYSICMQTDLHFNILLAFMGTVRS